MMRLLILTWACIASGVCLASEQIPGAPQQRPIALVNGTIHPVSGPIIERGVLIFDKGKITTIGAMDFQPAVGTEIVDLQGKHVYPGMIDAHSQLGLVEIPSVRATVDESEVGSINPNVKAQVAINPDTDLIPVTRSNGVLVVLTTPEKGLLSGTSALVQLDGWTWEEMTVKPDVSLHVQWPRMVPMQRWWLDTTPTGGVTDREKALEALRKTFAEARAYWTAKKAHQEHNSPTPDHDLRWEALIPVLERQRPVMIHADEIQQIQSAVAWARQENIRMILAGGYDAPLCAELLKENDVPVIVVGVHRLTRRRDDPYDTPYTVPERLRQAGIRFCIASNERDGNIRNLPYQAATATAYGLPAEEALKAVTLYPAQILGVDKQLGSLEAGKDATLFITTGNPLEIPSHVTGAYIQGRKVDLSDKQKRLWEKYQEKYRRQEKR